VALLEPHFWAAIFNFHGDFSQKVGNYNVATLRQSQTNFLSGNGASDHATNHHEDLD
jgi:hypothetical protein